MRAKWAGLALVAALLGGCQSDWGRGAPAPTDRQVRGPVQYVAPDTEFDRQRESVTAPGGTEPQPGNALGQFADNRFNSWTVSPRLDMPLAKDR